LLSTGGKKKTNKITEAQAVLSMSSIPRAAPPEKIEDTESNSITTPPASVTKFDFIDFWSEIDSCRDVVAEIEDIKSNSITTPPASVTKFDFANFWREIDS
jgi:hypothetical protein